MYQALEIAWLDASKKSRERSEKRQYACGLKRRALVFFLVLQNE